MIGTTKPRLLAALAVLFASASAGTAFAQEPAPVAPPPPVGGSIGVFGERGQFVVSSDLDFSLTRTSVSMGGGSSVLFSVTPSLDYFISPNFSVGGLVTFTHQTNAFDLGGGFGVADKTVFGLGARAGYHLVLTDVLSLWARLGLVFTHDSYDAGSAGDFSGNLFQLQLFAPLLWHPAPHFFIGAGPSLATDLMSSFEGNDRAKVTSFGILSTVGGYWGGL